MQYVPLLTNYEAVRLACVRHCPLRARGCDKLPPECPAGEAANEVYVAHLEARLRNAYR